MSDVVEIFDPPKSVKRIRPVGGGARKGNKFGLKLKDPKVRQEAYEKYCEWLALGKSSRSFTFKKGDLMCIGQTMESYMREYPEELPSIKKDYAYCQGLAKWEEVAELSARGENEANTASLQMIMRNKYGWDKKDPDDKQKVNYIEIINGVEELSEDTASSKAAKSRMETESSLSNSGSKRKLDKVRAK